MIKTITKKKNNKIKKKIIYLPHSNDEWKTNQGVCRSNLG